MTKLSILLFYCILPTDESGVKIFCFSFVISVAGIWILVLSGSVFFTLCSLFLFVSCRRGARLQSIDDRQSPRNTDESSSHQKDKSLTSR